MRLPKRFRSWLSGIRRLADFGERCVLRPYYRAGFCRRSSRVEIKLYALYAAINIQRVAAVKKWRS